MIIQCKQCRTKFRFDETQMDGDGLWMRCSRCQHVFFQDNPRKATPSAVSAPPVFSRDIPKEKPAGRLSFEPADDMPRKSVPDKDVESFLHDVMTTAYDSARRDEPKVQPADQRRIDPSEIDFSSDSENIGQEDADEKEFEEAPAPPVPKKSRRWKMALALWSILVIVVIPVVLGLFVFPQWGERSMQIFYKYVVKTKPPSGESVTALIKLQDIRQRVMNNYILGTIRIVEGYAVNQADFAVARIKVKAEIVDAYSVVLDERIGFAGNVLTDEELTNLSEEELGKKLSLPEGRDNINERVVPNGRIPFMLVFTKDTPGVIKTTVTIVGAERLL